MEILKEGKEEVYKNIELEVNEEELELLLTIYEEYCPEEERQKLKINWAVMHLLKTKVKNKRSLLEDLNFMEEVLNEENKNGC